MYDKLKKYWIKTWANGYIQVKLSWCNHPDCLESFGPLKMNHIEIYGHFWTDRQQKKTKFLGYSLKEALERYEDFINLSLSLGSWPCYY